jgi:hypothetical protein
VAVAGLTLLIAVLTTAQAVRRRVVALLLPVAVPVLVVDATLRGWAASNSNMGHAIPLVALQWLALLGLPPVVLVAGMLYVQRREHLLDMLAVGRAADRAAENDVATD